MTDRPVRGLIRKRPNLIAKIPKAVRESAFRERAAMIAELGCCLCAYPLTEHAVWCPAVAIEASQDAAKASASQ